MLEGRIKACTYKDPALFTTLEGRIRAAGNMERYNANEQAKMLLLPNYTAPSISRAICSQVSVPC